MPVQSPDLLDAKLAALASTARIERFVLRFVAPQEHGLARKRLAKPLVTLAGTAVTELVRRGLDVPQVEASTGDALRSVVRHAIDAGALPRSPADWPPAVFLARYPRICAQVIAVSSGYALPDVAARIVQDGNWLCPWASVLLGDR